MLESVYRGIGSSFRIIGGIVHKPIKGAYECGLWLDRWVVNRTRHLSPEDAFMVQTFFRFSPYCAAGFCLKPIQALLVTLGLFTFKAVATKGAHLDNEGLYVGTAIAYAHLGGQLLAKALHIDLTQKQEVSRYRKH